MGNLYFNSISLSLSLYTVAYTPTEMGANRVKLKEAVMAALNINTPQILNIKNKAG